MQSPQSDWFSEEETAGLPDFARVYDEHYHAVSDAVLELMRQDPKLSRILDALLAEQQFTEPERGRERFRQAMKGDWDGYLESLQKQGAIYARMGVPLLSWHRALKTFTSELVTLILKAYPQEPERQRRALLAMHAFFEWAMAILSEVYLSTSKEALIKSETRFRRLSDAGFMGVMQATLDGRIVEANDAYLALTGRTRAELEAGAVNTPGLTPQEWWPVDAASVAELKATGVTQPHEKEYVLPNGERVPVMVGAAMLDEETCIAFVLDLTQQKQLQRFRARSLRLEVENRRIHEANRLKSEFLANMSHELRTPLNAIIGFTELIQSKQVTAEMAEFDEFVGDILASGRHLLQLINDVLDLSKVEAGRLEFHSEVVDLGRVVHEVVSILRTTAAQKRLTVTTEIDPRLATLFIDAARLKQVLYNYISNALKFTDPEGKVIIRGRPEEPGFFRLEVEDTGIGIARSDLPRLFTEFQQLDTGAGKTQPGTGLGLALTKRLAEAQGGSVGVHSELGKGSTFFALLPRTATQGEPLPPPTRLPGAPGAPSILVVEDDAKDQAIIVRTLTAVGYAVDTASTGTQALEQCRERQYDAITLDLLLPDASGLEVLQAIRASPLNRDVPVIVISVVTENGAAAGYAVHDILAKPVSGASILSSLERAGVRPERTGWVLVVDHDEASTQLMSATLERLGYQCHTASRGSEGLSFAVEDPPIAVILDLLMPEMDGFEFLERFRQLPRCRHVPVIVWTVKNLNLLEYRRLEASVQGILQKGNDAGSVILQALRTFLPPAARP